MSNKFNLVKHADEQIAATRVACYGFVIMMVACLLFIFLVV